MELSKPPIFRMYKLMIDSTDRQSFADEGTHNMLMSIQNEPGTLAMYATHEDLAGTTNFVFELYQDDENYQVHASSPQFKRYGQLASEVIRNTEVHELQPKYLITNGPFVVSGVNEYRGRLYEFTMAKKEIKHWKHLLDDELVSSSDIARGISTFYVASLNNDQTSWMVLVIYKDQATVNVAESRVDEVKSELDADVVAHELHIDTMVSQAEMTFNDLD